jgi:GNAT superfamily N-acetyltransferase
MTKYEMLCIVQSQLATDLNCTSSDLNGEKDSFFFTEARDNPGRRPFPRSEQHFEMLSMGKSIVVSASPVILEIVEPLLNGKGRDEAFSMPFVYGHSLYYLPDLNEIKPIDPPDGFIYEMVEQDDIPALYQCEGFRNAVQYDVNHPRPDILVILAKKDSQIVGMAGASNDCAMMWQVGMDVLPEYRNFGLAAYLVNRLTLEILNRRYVPYYGTSSSNIASQRVAHRAGYYPAWVCAYKGRFDGLDLSPTS